MAFERAQMGSELRICLLAPSFPLVIAIVLETIQRIASVRGCSFTLAAASFDPALVNAAVSNKYLTQPEIYAKTN